MCELAYRRVAEIVKNVGGPTEKKRFEELSKTIERVQDQPSDEIGRVVKLRNIKGITSITKVLKKLYSIFNSYIFRESSHARKLPKRLL